MTNEREMTCDDALRFLAEYLDGELPGTTDRDLERHLHRCRSCYSRAEFERRVKERVAAVRRAEVRPEFAQRIRDLLDRFTPRSGTTDA